MLLDWVAELKDNIDRHGIRFGLVLTLYAIFRKERRNYRLDLRDEVHNAYFAAILANQKLIMDKLGVGDSWNAEKPSLSKDSARTTFLSLQRVISLVLNAVLFTHPKVIKNYTLSRRRKTVNTNINWTTLVPCLLGAVKLILQPMGINLPDQNLNEIANGVAALATVIGIIYSHRKQSQPPAQPNSKNFIQG